jgi:hypothetical protein
MFGQIVLANHYASDVTEDSLASGWSAFPTPDGSPDFTAAKGWLASSPYAENGRCVDPSCRSVTVLLLPDIASEAGGIARNLARLGIRAKVIVSNDFYAEKGSCLDPSLHVGLCVGDGWSPDTPSPGNGLITFFGGPGVSPIPTVTHMGVDAAELARLGSPVDMVPSVDAQIAACNQQVGASSIVCWTRLDQYLVSQLMPSVPLAFQQVTRITDPSIQGFTWDLGVQLPVLDRLVSTAG